MAAVAKIDHGVVQFVGGHRPGLFAGDARIAEREVAYELGRKRTSGRAQSSALRDRHGLKVEKVRKVRSRMSSSRISGDQRHGRTSERDVM